MCDEPVVNEMKKKADMLKEASQLDVQQHINLWRDTFHLRRHFIRQNSTSDIISNFPGYSCAPLVWLCSPSSISTDFDLFNSKIFEEVKLLVGVDVCLAVRQKFPSLLDRVSAVPAFITGKGDHSSVD